MGVGDFLTVVIADDEQPIRDELAHFPWEENEAVLVGSARNGDEALELCRELKPSILITDITMPGIDGLELARIITREQPGLALVFLTCHKDFDYIKESMKNGAVDYLLKGTLEDEDIINTLQNCRQKRHSHLSLQARERINVRTYQSELLVRIIQEEPLSQEEFISTMKDRGLNLNFPLSFIYLRVGVNIHAWPFLQEEIKTYLNRLGIWLTTGMGQFFLLTRRGEEGNLGRDDLDRILEEIRELLRKSVILFPNEIPLYAVSFERPLDYNTFIIFLSRINYWEDLKFYHPDRESFSGDALPHDETKKNFSLYAYFESLRAEKKLNPSWLRETLVPILYENPLETNILKGQVLQARALWRDLNKDRESSFSSLILKAKDLDTLVGLILHDMEQEEGDRSSWRYEVKEALSILETEYDQPLGLSQVADRVGLTPSYLNRLFSEVTAKTVNEYLLDLRINEAGRLLSESSLKIYEIAQRVGIPNYRYFSLVFRKKTQVSPGDWRKGNRS